MSKRVVKWHQYEVVVYIGAWQTIAYAREFAANLQAISGKMCCAQRAAARKRKPTKRRRSK